MLKKQQGFTLIEMMVALLIFAVVALMCAQGIKSIALMQGKQRRMIEQLSKIQMIYAVLQRDFTQAINKPIRSSDGVIRGFLGGNSARLPSELFELTRMGVPNPDVNKLAISSLRRVGYFLDNHVLSRASWRNINQAAQQQPARQILATDVKTIQVQYIDVQGKAQDNWSSQYPVNLTSIGPKWKPIINSKGLPVAVHVELMMQDNSKFSWWFLLPGGRRVVN